MTLTEIMHCRSNVSPTVLPNPSNAIKSATVPYVLAMLLFLALDQLSQRHPTSQHEPRLFGSFQCLCASVDVN